MMDVRLTQAIRGYGASRVGIEPEQSPAGNALHRAAVEFSETLATSETVASEAMLGKADPHALVEALANSQLAVETAVTVRDKVVEAYQEILRMPV